MPGVSSNFFTISMNELNELPDASMVPPDARTGDVGWPSSAADDMADSGQSAIRLPIIGCAEIIE